MRPYNERSRGMAPWRGVTMMGATVGILLTAVPSGISGQGPSAGEVDRAVAARARYGFSDGRDTVIRMLARDTHPASEEYGFPMTTEEAEDLLARSAFAQRVSEKTLPYLESVEGYAGEWVDQADGGSLVVMLTPAAGASTREAIREHMPSVSRGVRFKEVDDSFADLESALARAENIWSRTSPSISPNAFGIDVRRNRLVVKVPWDDVDQAERARQQVATDLGVDVAIEGTSPIHDSVDYSACSSRMNCFGPFRSGIVIRYGGVSGSYRCSMGFHMTHPSSSTLDHTFLTAGHCGHGRDGNWYHSTAYTDAYGIIGERKSSRYTSDNRDMMLVKIGDWAQNKSRRVYGEVWTAEMTQMTQPSQPIEGETLCASLGMQGEVYCGDADATHQKWWSETAGIWVWGSGLDLCCDRTTIGGDSGSPLYRRYQVVNPPVVTHVTTPIGIVDAGEETQDFQEFHSIYFARVKWATDDADGWPGLDIYTGSQGVGGPP